MSSSSASASPSRCVLAGVPRVAFFPGLRKDDPQRGPEDIIFPACMRSVLQFLGHPEYDYVHFVGVTGAGFYLNWKDGWHADNSAIYFMVPFADHLKLFEYAFDSAGYAMEFVPLKGTGAVGEEVARRRVLESLRAGKPVLSHGVVGPPETCVVAGYDGGGDVLVGWSFFQDAPGFAQGIELEPNGMFRKRNWYASAFDLFLFGERQEPVDPRTVRRRSLEWAVKVVRTVETWDGRTHNGLAAYDAWAAHLLRDADITPDGTVPPGSTETPFGAHDCAVGLVAEARHYVSEYLIRVAQAEIKMRAPLLKAAGCYAREHELMWDIWACCGGPGRGPDRLERFAEPATRRKIADLIHAAKREDEQAVAYMEAALGASR